MAAQLFRQAVGREAGTEDVDTLDPGIFEDYFKRRLEALQAEASATRRSIPVGELDALFLAPADIGAMWGEDGGLNQRDLGGWKDMDESDLHPLDPGALSLVGFHYESVSANYIFHLPLRTAERFVPVGEIAALRSGSGRTREAGEYFGREITEEESLAQPIRALLEAFGVDIELVCPYNLEDKSAYVEEKRRHAAERYFFNRRGEEWDDEEFLDDEGEW